MEIRRYLKLSNHLLYKLLPPIAYIVLASKVIPLLDSRRRGSGAKFSKHGNLYKVNYSGSEFLFNSQFKVGRFMFPDKEFGDLVFERYTVSDVIVESGDIVIDVGANIGEFSYSAAKIARKVISVEPDASAYRCLSENVKKLDNVSCNDYAVTEHDGEFDFYLSSGTSDSSLLEPSSGTQRTERVKGRTLRSIMLQHGISQVDFLKLEAEGYEPEILQGAGSALRAIRKVALDASPERYGEPTHEKCMEVLAAAGFSVWRVGWIVFGINPEIAPVESACS